MEFFMKNVSVLFVLSLLSTTSVLRADPFNPADATIGDIDRKMGKLQKKLETPLTNAERKNIIQDEKNLLVLLRKAKVHEDSDSLKISVDAYSGVTEKSVNFRRKQLEEAFENLEGLKILPPEMLQFIVNELPLKDILGLRLTAKGFKIITEGCPNYSKYSQINTQIKITRNTVNALSKYVDAVIDALQKEGDDLVKIKSLSESCVLALNVRRASKNWKVSPSLAKYDSLIQYSQKIPIFLSHLSDETIDDLAKAGWDEAREEKFTRLTNKGEQNNPETATLNNKWAKEGHLPSKLRKFEGLLKGINGYKLNPKKAVKLNDKWANNGDSAAGSRQFVGLYLGTEGYPKDHERATNLVDSWAKKGEAWARRMQIFLLRGTDKTELEKSYIDQWVQEGDSTGRHLLLNGLRTETHGYIHNKESANSFLAQWAQEGDPDARKMLYSDLMDGSNGLSVKKDIELGEKLRKQWAQEGDSWARGGIIADLLTGFGPFPKNHDKAYRLMKKWLVLPSALWEK
jgi:hypothetical protein